MNIDAFDFDLPRASIAQEPTARRDDARLLVLDRESGATVHGRFADLGDHLAPGDLLVLNDTKVFPARLHGLKATGGRVEVLLVERVGAEGPTGQTWRALIDGSRSLRPGARLTFPGSFAATVLEREGDAWLVRLDAAEGRVEDAIAAIGEVPLPPYIHRSPEDARADADRERYQTVYASTLGAVAAPTAGLHFTPELLESLRARGVATATLTLHVGPGTFLPVRVAEVEQHRLHDEAYVLPAATADAVGRARARGGRVVAVGTTVARTLESCAGPNGVVAGSGRTGLFIYPGYRFQVVNALVTNFHLPRSTLLMLVCAFAGTDRVLAAYAEAVRTGYRFYSYGDAMLVKSA